MLPEPHIEQVLTAPENLNKEIDEYRKQRPYLDTVFRQASMMIVRQIQAYKRNLPSFIFDVQLPVTLVGLGLIFSMFQFKIIDVTQTVKVDSFHLPQRVMLNNVTHLQWKLEEDEDIELEDDYVDGFLSPQQIF